MVRTLRKGAYGFAGLADPISLGPRWLPSTIAAGAIPFLLSWALGTGGHQAASAMLLVLVCLPLVRADAWLKGIAAISVAYLAHSLLVIAMGYAFPREASAILPDADNYWQKQLSWICTGRDPEYQLSAWVPAHLQLLGAVVLYGFTSLGGLVFYEGFYEVDLMNFYNAQVLRNSADLLALPFAWHPWSVFRGLGFVLITFEVISLSLQTMSGVRLSSWRRRSLRWTAGIGFLLVDGLTKYTLLEPIRRQLCNFLMQG